MEMTKQQRNSLMVFGIFVACYFVHGFIGSLFQLQIRQQQSIIRDGQQRARAKAAAAKLPKKAVSVKSTAPPIMQAPGAINQSAVPKPGGYNGVWTGTSAIEGRGLCNLRLELHDKGENQFSGFSTLGCTVYGVLLLPKQQLNSAKAFMNKVNPSAAIISGVMENGAIRFRFDKTIGTDSAGCALTNLTLTPFGFNQLAAEWKEGEGCPSGNPLLHKVGK